RFLLQTESQSARHVAQRRFSILAWPSYHGRAMLLHDIFSCGRKPAAGFVGDHRSEETPVPIPNTEVKLGPPMILHSGKVGHRRLHEPLWENPGRLFSLSTPL